jgi:hypothetical protein
VSVEAVGATHYRVACVLCRVDAFVCPERDTSIDVWDRAVSAFHRAGWHCDPPRLRQPKAQKAAESMGEGRWYCPKCAKARP